jgi:hypothetical protein
MLYVFKSQLLKRFLVASIFVCAASFYTLIIVPESIRNAAEIVAVGVMLLFLFIDMFSGQESKIKQYFKFEIYLFLLALFFSMIMAKTFHGQDLTTTLVVQRFMYFYFFYFFIHSLKLQVEYVERMIIPFAFVYIFIWVMQYILYPTLIVDSGVNPGRGTVRTFIPGTSFLVLAYYKSLQSFFQNHKVKDISICLIIYAIHGVLQGTRQSFASITLLTAAYIFFSKQVKSKMLTLILASIAGLAVFIIFYDVLSAMMAVTENQMGHEKENIRITALRFFVIEFHPSWLTYIFGNGADSMKSNYGQLMYYYRTLGLFRSDIGILGHYSTFGVLFVIAQLSIILRIIFTKLPKELLFFRYFFISILLVSFTGRNMFGRGDGIVFIGIVLYMIDYYRSKESPNSSLDKEIANPYPK